MRPFKWSKANAVFVPEIDAEHRTIFRLGEELQQALLAGAPLPEVLTVFRELTAHSEEHFQHEERLMRSTRYPILEWHKQQHDTVRKRLKQFGPGVEAGDMEAADQLVEFIAGWLRDHTRLADRMMGAFVRNHERARAVA